MRERDQKLCEKEMRKVREIEMKRKMRRVRYEKR